MDDQTALRQKFAVFGWGSLFIWWGIAVLVGPITLGMAAIGTGLILFGLNAAKTRAGIRVKSVQRSNAITGTIAITWGVLDTVRHALGWDAGASFALFLFVVGAVLVGSILFPADRRSEPEVG
jgi:hypothetical protein